MIRCPLPATLLVLMCSAGSLSADLLQADLLQADDAVYARFDLRGLDASAVEALRRSPDLYWWVEAEDELLVLAPPQALGRSAIPGPIEILALEPRPSRLHVVRGARLDDLRSMDADILIHGGRHAVIQARSDRRPHPVHASHGSGRHAHAELLPFTGNLVLARAARSGAVRRLSFMARRWSSSVDGARWMSDVATLAGYNRYTHGSEIADARDWLVAQFSALPGVTVTTPSFSVGATTAYNVVATVTGSERPAELYVVGAHYDSISQNPGSAAPGAEDNASGCAGVLELARVVTASPPPATVIFVCYSGEEQGLYGGSAHAAGLVSAGVDDDVRLALNMDMIGFTADADLDCLLETSSTHSALVDVFTAAASTTSLRIVVSYNPFGSDHVPYLNRGMPGLLTIENDWDEYPCYHSTCDLDDQIDLAMGREVLKMNAAAMAEMMGASDLIFGDGFESGDTSKWSLP